MFPMTTTPAILSTRPREPDLQIPNTIRQVSPTSRQGTASQACKPACLQSLHHTSWQGLFPGLAWFVRRHYRDRGEPVNLAIQGWIMPVSAMRWQMPGKNSAQDG